MTVISGLPPGVTVFERGWLSSNNVLFHGDGPTACVDTGYATHAGQTVDLMEAALGGRALDIIANTHLHSDHCGGNAALQALYPRSTTCIPPGLADAVRRWDPVALTHQPTGQQCPRFRVDSILEPGREILLGDRAWEIHAAPGHDQHSVILFEPRSRALISADALWKNGFGVVFQELEGARAFDEVGDTLDLIESLRPAVVVPGHGEVFTEVNLALAAARGRLDAFSKNPRKHAAHGAKVLLKFKLLELQEFHIEDFVAWAASTAYLRLVHGKWFAEAAFSDLILSLADDLVRVGAAERTNEHLRNR